jgi:hypothetical protein
MKPVLGRRLFLLLTRLQPFGFVSRRKTPLECIQNGRNMVYELCAGNRRRGGEFRIRIYRAPPCAENVLTPFRQEASQFS